jgi:hypothetical protein
MLKTNLVIFFISLLSMTLFSSKSIACGAILSSPSTAVKKEDFKEKITSHFFQKITKEGEKNELVKEKMAIMSIVLGMSGIILLFISLEAWLILSVIGLILGFIGLKSDSDKTRKISIVGILFSSTPLIALLVILLYL